MTVDTCYNSLRIDQDVFSLLSSGTLCNTVFQGDGIPINNNTIAGFLTSLSSNVVAANRVLAPRKIPIVSSSATSSLLSNQATYPYFARTVPPDDYQMKVIASILKDRDWNSASVVYSQEAYGISGATELAKMAMQEGTCLGLQVAVPDSATVAEARDALQSLVTGGASNVVVLIAVDPRTILMAAKELGILDDYIWIGTETWGSREDIIDGMKNDLLGAITVELKSYLVDEFSRYVSELTFNERKNIPNAWFEEFYQTYHRCTLASATVTLPYSTPCSNSLVINPNDIITQPYVLNTIAATYSYVNALESLAQGACNGRTFQSCLSDPANWDKLFEEILKLSWNMNGPLTLKPPSSFDVTANFNAERFWDQGYVINNYDRVNNTLMYRQVSNTKSHDFSQGNLWIKYCLDCKTVWLKEIGSPFVDI